MLRQWSTARESRLESLEIILGIIGTTIVIVTAIVTNRRVVKAAVAAVPELVCALMRRVRFS